MIIHLKGSIIFTTEPAKRFAREYNVPEEAWLSIWIRHKIYDFEFDELVDYAEFKCGKPIHRNTIRRWIKLTEVFSRSYDVLKKGGTTVVSSYFGDLEEFVVRELLRQLKSSNTKTSRSII